MSWVIQLPFGFQSPPTLSDLQSVLQDAYSPPPLMTCCGSQSKPVMSPLRLHRNVKFYSTDLKLLCVVLKTKRHACLSSRILSFHKGPEPQLIDTFFMCFFPFFSQLGLFQRCERSCCVITINSISCVLSTDWALSLSLSLSLVSLSRHYSKNMKCLKSAGHFEHKYGKNIHKWTICAPAASCLHISSVHTSNKNEAI